MGVNDQPKGCCAGCTCACPQQRYAPFSALMIKNARKDASYLIDRLAQVIAELESYIKDGR